MFQQNSKKKLQAKLWGLYRQRAPCNQGLLIEPESVGEETEASVGHLRIFQ